jgi:hypothetical protein
MQFPTLKGGDAMRRASSFLRSSRHLTDAGGDNTGKPAL